MSELVLVELRRFEAPKKLGRTRHGVEKYRSSGGAELYKLVKDVRYGPLGPAGQGKRSG
jgi:hypothetical protein